MNIPKIPMPKKTQTRLLPCPFCGYQAVVTQLGRQTYEAHCLNGDYDPADDQMVCLVGMSARTKARAIAKWNRRSIPPLRP